MRRQIFILFLAFSLLLSACGSEGGAASSSSASSPPAEDHSVGGSPAPEEFAAPLTLAAYPTASFHPVLSGNKANLTLAPLLYEGLFAVDSQFQAVPLLCEGYTVSEDRLTWTFTLRSGVTFSDGTPLTGETAAQALQTALDILTQACAGAGPEGLAIQEFSSGETAYDGDSRLLRKPAQAVCTAYLYAITEADGTFLDFEIRGERIP